MFVLTEQDSLQDVKQDLLWCCPEFPESGLTPALDWPAGAAGWIGAAGRTSWHGLLGPPEPWHWESICSCKMYAHPKSRVLTPGLRWKESVLCTECCCRVATLSSLTPVCPWPRRGEHWLHTGGALGPGVKLYCDQLITTMLENKRTNTQGLFWLFVI